MTDAADDKQEPPVTLSGKLRLDLENMRFVGSQRPTMALRAVHQLYDGKMRIQQMWSDGAGNAEWRDIPIVVETGPGFVPNPDIVR